MTYNQANIAAYQYDVSNAGPIVAGGGGGGPQGPNGDNYFYSHLQVDLQGTYKLPKGFTAVAYGLNLNNEVFGFYNGSKSTRCSASSTGRRSVEGTALVPNARTIVCNFLLGV